MYRRCESAWHLRLDDGGALSPVRLAAMQGDRSPRLTGAQRYPAPPTLAGDGGRALRPFEHDASAYAILAASLGLGADAFEAELAHRSAFLTNLGNQKICDPVSVTYALADYPAEGAAS
jgi:hypothetical protein